MYNGLLGAYLSIISSRRPQAVEKMHELLDGLIPTWYVPEEEKLDYLHAGAHSVRGEGSRPGIPISRNAALEDAFREGHICIQIDDDVKSASYIDLPSQPDRRLSVQEKTQLFRDNLKPTTLPESLRRILWQLKSSGYNLGGTTLVANPLFLMGMPPVQYNRMIGSCFVIKPTPLRFDEDFLVSEDSDYSLQHMKVYGGVVSMNWELLDFQHWSEGGTDGYRDAEFQLRAHLQLIKKWKGAAKIKPAAVSNILDHKMPTTFPDA